VSQSQKTNSWSRAAAPQTRQDSRPERDRGQHVEWRLAPLTVADGDILFEPALANPLLRILTMFAKGKRFVLALGLLLIGVAG
jgi:hypothetical protein